MGFLLNDFSTVLWLAVLFAGILALAATVHTCKVAFGPFVKLVRWLFGYTPGEEPSEFVTGLARGARMLAWIGVVSFVTYFVVNRFILHP